MLSLLTCLLLLPLSLLIRALYRLFFHPLSSFPGPWYLSISRLPIDYHHYIKGDIVPYYRCLHSKYGHTVRVAPNILSCTHADVWPQVYAAQRGAWKENPKVLEQYPVNPKDWAQNIFTASHEDHARQRRVLAPAFSDKALREQEPLIQGIVGLLVDRMKRHCEKGEVLNLVDLFHFTFFDLTGLLLFGKSFGCLEKEKYHPWVGIIFDSFQVSMLVSAIRNYPLGRGLLTWLPKRLKDLEAEHRDYVVQAVRKRLEKGITDTKDLVTLTIQDGDPKYSLSRAELTETATLFIVAGSETTATTMCGLMYHLAQDSKAYDRLGQEIRQKCPDENAITFDSTKGMRFLHACLKETLRIYTPVVLNTCRTIKPGGAVIDGHYIPAGALVSASHNVAYMSAENFRDPDSFLPERWLPEGEEHFRSDSKTVLEPFSVGPRSCIGKNLAWAEMRVIAARLLWNFDMKLMPEAQNWHKRQRSFFLWEKLPLPVGLTKAERHAM